MPGISKGSTIKFLLAENKCYAFSLSLSGTASALDTLVDAFNKSETGEVALSENLKSIFSNSSTRFQLQIVQFGQYYQEDRKQVYSRGIPLSNGNNIFYFILLDKQNDNIIFIEKSKSFGDVRDKEQTDRQILKCLRKLYYN
jgi:hypothetical protein